MAMKDLTEKEVQIVVNALTIAADRYHEDAEFIKLSDLNPHSRLLLIEQFELQAKEALELAEMIQDWGNVKIGGMNEP